MDSYLLAPWSDDLITVNSGAGGDISVPVTVPTGQIWKLIHAVASHTDATGSRLIQFLAGALTLPGEGTVATGVRVWLPAGSYILEPLILSPGGIVFKAVVYSVAAAKDCNLRVIVQKFYGVYPLL